MAVFAYFGRIDVVSRLAGGRPPIVAAEALVSDPGMINMDNFPLPAVVAIRAVRAAWRMVCGFAVCHPPVVASDAICRHALEHSAFMANFTNNTDMGP